LTPTNYFNDLPALSRNLFSSFVFAQRCERPSGHVLPGGDVSQGMGKKEFAESILRSKTTRAGGRAISESVLSVFKGLRRPVKRRSFSINFKWLSDKQ
jgi:hypothetical protein